MSLEHLVDKYKNKKIGNPRDAIKIADLDATLLDSVRDSITTTYDLTDPAYATKEHVFFDTRRIVADSKYNPKKNQIFSNLDFDHALNRISTPVVEQIQTLIPGYVPVLTQLATILPRQSLKWHIDVFMYQQFTNKLHIPIITNPNALFEVLVDGKVNRINMTAGGIWNIDNLVIHRSINYGDTFRTHLIIDVMDEITLNELSATGIDFFHTKLISMSNNESVALSELRNLWGKQHAT